MKKRFVFFGTSDFAVPSLQKLLESSEFECVGVVTNADKKVGRKQELLASPAKREALKHGLTVHTPSKLKEFFETYKSLSPDFGVVVSYGKIIPKDFIDLPEFGIINVHASLLPRHRGAAPIQSTILAGDTETGITIMKIDPGVDTGPTLAMQKVLVSPHETSAELFERLAPLGAKLLAETLPRYFSGEIQPQPQPEEGATYASMIKKEDGRLNFAEPAEILERKVRAYTPWPGAFFLLEGKMVKVFSAGVVNSLKNDLQPGIIHVENQKLLIGTSQEMLEIQELQREGKKRQSATQFILGYKNLDSQKAE